MRLSKKKILALCMSGALILSSVPGVYMESTAANKSSVAVVKLSETNLNLSINSLNFPLFSRLPAIENSIYVSFSLVFALMG